MPGDVIPEPLALDASVEDEVRKLLVDYFAPIYRERTAGYVDLLLVIDYYAARYLYLRSVVGAGVFSPARAYLCQALVLALR